MARPRKPTNLKIVNGNPGKRALNNQEPDPDYLSDLAAPAYLPKSACAVWDEIAPSLRKARLLTVVDVPMLAMACVAIAQYRRATALVEQDGFLTEHENGSVSLSSPVIAQSMSFKQAVLVLREFGMSPAARSRVVTTPQGDLFGNGDKAQNYFS